MYIHDKIQVRMTNHIMFDNELFRCIVKGFMTFEFSLNIMASYPSRTNIVPLKSYRLSQNHFQLLLRKMENIPVCLLNENSYLRKNEHPVFARTLESRNYLSNRNRTKI